MSRFRMVLAEAFRSLRASMSTTVAASMTVLVAMLVLGTTIGLGTWLLSYSDHIKKQLVVNVYFNTEPPETKKQLYAIMNKFNPSANELVSKTTFVSKEEALKEQKKKFPALTRALPFNPYPDAVRIQPKKAEYLNDIRGQLRPLPPGVHDVKDGGDTSKRVLKVGGILSVVFLVGVIMLLIASTLLIANTIRLSIFSRRREIEVMKLVGATNWFVRGPFMIEGLLCGLAGSVAAVILLMIGKAALLPSIGIGLTLGLFGTGITLRRFLQV